MLTPGRRGETPQAVVGALLQSFVEPCGSTPAGGGASGCSRASRLDQRPATRLASSLSRRSTERAVDVPRSAPRSPWRPARPCQAGLSPLARGGRPSRSSRVIRASSDREQRVEAGRGVRVPSTAAGFGPGIGADVGVAAGVGSGGGGSGSGFSSSRARLSLSTLTRGGAPMIAPERSTWRVDQRADLLDRHLAARRPRGPPGSRPPRG